MELVGREFVNRLKRVLKTKKLLSGDLVKVINDRSRKTFSVVDKSRCAAMYLVHSVILGEKAGNRVREDWLAFTVTPEFFSSYPWGRESYNKLLKNFNRDLYGKAKLRELRIKEGEPESLSVTYTISCFWQAFFVWAYEVVPVIGELVGSRSTENPDAIPRLLRWHRGEGEKNVHQDNLDRIFSMNEFHCSPMLRPSNQELESLWMEGFAEMEDVVDPMINVLKRQLEDVIILRPCDRMRIEAASTPPQEAEDAATEAATAQTRPSQSPPQQFRDDIERPSPTHFGGFDDYCGSMPSSSRRDNFGASRALMQKISSLEEKIVQISTEFNEVKGQMSTELSEMKEINTKLQTEMKKMSKRIDNLVRLSDPPQPRIKRPVYWLNSPSWTIEGKKRKAPSKIDIAKRIQFGVKRKKI